MSFIEVQEAKAAEEHTIVLSTIFALVKSVAVHSIKTFFVFREIAECAPLMIGGKDNTLLVTHGKTENSGSFDKKRL